MTGGGHPGHVPGELLQQTGFPGRFVVLRPSPIGTGTAGLAEGGVQPAVELAQVGTAAAQDAGGGAVAVSQDADEQMFRPHQTAAQPVALLGGDLDDAAAPRGQAHGGAAAAGAHPHQTGDGGLDGGLLDACGGQSTSGGTLGLSEQSQQEMFTSHIAMPQLGRAFPCQTQGVLCLARQITACHNPFILSVKRGYGYSIQVFPPSYRKNTTCSGRSCLTTEKR